MILKDNCKAKEIDKLIFFDKMGKAFDLQDINEKNIYDRIDKLNRLRNKIGHELEFVLSESDVDSLGYFSGKEYVLKKYDIDNLEVLLRDTLIDTVIDVGLVVFQLVSKEKDKAIASNLASVIAEPVVVK